MHKQRETKPKRLMPIIYISLTTPNTQKKNINFYVIVVAAETLCVWTTCLIPFPTGVSFFFFPLSSHNISIRYINIYIYTLVLTNTCIFSLYLFSLSFFLGFFFLLLYFSSCACQQNANKLAKQCKELNKTTITVLH